MVQTLAFYLFSAVMIASALMVIVSRNPVHSVLFLILSFFNAAALFVLLGAEFLAMILVVVYVGAVAVLFLFVVMMLDIDFAALRKGSSQYVVFGVGFGAALLGELASVLALWKSGLTVAPPPTPGQLSNTEALGRVLYTDYIFYFQTAGMVLLVAMIGAIVLTLRHRPGVRRQSIARQVARDPKTAIEMRNVKPGEGS